MTVELIWRKCTSSFVGISTHWCTLSKKKISDLATDFFFLVFEKTQKNEKNQLAAKLANLVDIASLPTDFENFIQQSRMALLPRFFFFLRVSDIRTDSSIFFFSNLLKALPPRIADHALKDKVCVCVCVRVCVRVLSLVCIHICIYV